MAREITQFLLSAQSPDAKVRTEAEGNLRQFQEQNLPSFLLSLSVEISDRPIQSRILAGTLLKNFFDAKDAGTKENLVQQWVVMDFSDKRKIKELLLGTLESSALEARHIASQVIAKIASFEIPRKEWPELIGFLIANVTSKNYPARLETLGYVLKEISYEDLVHDQVNPVLAAVLQGMKVSEPEVQLAATRAFYYTLDFARANFQNEIYRNFIMKVVCDTAVAKESEIKRAAYECLVSIATTYYEVLGPYMENIFKLTEEAVRRAGMPHLRGPDFYPADGREEVPVALLAIEYWNSICEIELKLQDYKVPQAGDSSPPHFQFIEKALPSLVPMLLANLEAKDWWCPDDGTWNITMACRTCLGLVARTVGDAILPHFRKHLRQALVQPGLWTHEATIYAFGSILEGPSVEELVSIFRDNLTFFLGPLKHMDMEDEAHEARYAAAWALSRIFELFHSPASAFSVIPPAGLPEIMDVLLKTLEYKHCYVAEKVCGAIYYLYQGYGDAGPNSSLLTEFLPSTIRSLIAAADRTGLYPVNLIPFHKILKLRSSAYVTLKEVVRCSILAETSQILAELLTVIISKLAQTFDLPIRLSDDRGKQGDLQADLCGVLQVLIQKLGSTEETKVVVLKAADQMMALFLKVFSCRSSTVHEEAMLAIGALAYATGLEFERHMQKLSKYLEMGLQNFAEYQVCAISVGVVGEICRALDEKVLPYCDGIMAHFLNSLYGSECDRSVILLIFTCFGDVALAIGEHFERYISHVVEAMQKVAQIFASIDDADKDTIDYGNQLRISIFEAYPGIFRGFKKWKPALMLPHTRHLLHVIEAACKYAHRDDRVMRAAVTALGYLADSVGANGRALLMECTFYTDVLEECIQSEDEQLKQAATWTQEMIGRVFA